MRLYTRGRALGSGRLSHPEPVHYREGRLEADMDQPDSRPPGEPDNALSEAYTMHVLPALDGVLLYLTVRGEHVGTYFGATERAAAAAAAEDLIASVTVPRNEVGA